MPSFSKLQSWVVQPRGRRHGGGSSAGPGAGRYSPSHARSAKRCGPGMGTRVGQRRFRGPVVAAPAGLSSRAPRLVSTRADRLARPRLPPAASRRSPLAPRLTITHIQGRYFHKVRTWRRAVASHARQQWHQEEDRFSCGDTHPGKRSRSRPGEPSSRSMAGSAQ